MTKNNNFNKNVIYIFIFVILFQGFGYNSQFDYLLLVEIIMFISIRENINFFEIVDKINLKERRSD